MDKDELKSCEQWCNDDYTLKIYQREDCRYYAIVVYETDEDSKVIYTSTSQQDASKAKGLAIENIKKHMREMLRK